MTHDVVENEPARPSRGLRVFAVLAAAGVAALIVSRIMGSAGEPLVGPPPLPPPSPAPEVPAPTAARPAERWRPITDAPPEIRAIELVSASRLALQEVPLDGTFGQTAVTSDRPLTTDDLALLLYGAGSVVGPAPGTSVAGLVRMNPAGTSAPAKPVAGIVEAIGGNSYWVMGTARSAAGGCQMRLVAPEGHLLEPPVEHPCDFVPWRETATGFVGRVGSAVDPWNGQLLGRETGTLTALGGSLMAANDHSVVLRNRDPYEPLVVEDLASGDRVEAVLPPGRVTRQVELSADGRHLALVLTERLASVRAYEVWVHDLVHGTSRVALVTTLDESPLELTWLDDVLVVVGDAVDVYDAASGALYRTEVEPIPSRVAVVARSGGWTPTSP